MKDRKDDPERRKGRIRQNLVGKRFGKLTVQEYILDGKNAHKWKCQCDCGNTVYKTTGHLNANAASCGCVKKQDLTGKRFGRLVVLEKMQKRKQGGVVWSCLCDCGNTCEKTTGQLNAGLATSCGCAWRQPAVHEGDRFGKLVAVRPTEQRNAKSIVWECLCDCGNRVNVRATLLTSRHTTSCGCVKREIDNQRDFKDILTYADDTCIEFAKNIGKARAGTSAQTGVRGVTMRNGKYQAQIVFQKRRYDLGRYARLEDAAAARKRAEERVAEYVESYLAGDPLPAVRIGD